MSTDDSAQRPEDEEGSSQQSRIIEKARSTAKSIWTQQTQSALSSAEDSQKSLQSQLEILEKDMEEATEALSTLHTISDGTSRNIIEAHECLARTRRKLTTVRGRVGRLRTFEQAQRLSLARNPSVSP